MFVCVYVCMHKKWRTNVCVIVKKMSIFIYWISHMCDMCKFCLSLWNYTNRKCLKLGKWGMRKMFEICKIWNLWNLKLIELGMEDVKCKIKCGKINKMCAKCVTIFDAENNKMMNILYSQRFCSFFRNSKAFSSLLSAFK